MAKPQVSSDPKKQNKKPHQPRVKSKDKVLNAFDTAVDDEYYIRGLRQQQDIDLDEIADERLKKYLNNEVDPEDDEEISSDGVMGSDSDISIGSDGNEDEWGDSFDEDELLPLSAIWDMDEKQKGKSKPIESNDTPNEVLSAESSDHLSDSESSSNDEESNADSESESDIFANSGESSHESDSDDEADLALNRAIKKVASTQPSTSYHKLAEASAENPFALGGDSQTDVSLADFAPGLGEAKTLAIPQPKRIQDRATRDAAFGIAKKEVGKWSDTVTSNRQAENLQFPINPKPKSYAPSPFAPTNTIGGGGSSTQTDLEKNIANILEQSQLADEKTVSTFEEMAPSKLSLEEVKERRNQLRYMRELMFREEQRAKRIKKIKSKAYRKIHKKERERMAELESGSDADENEDLKAEKARVLERATLRHKTNSKWARRMREQGMFKDAGTRAELEEMIRQSESLRQKIGGEEDADGADFPTNLDDEFNDLESAEKEPKQKGLLGMKFMKDFEDREREENKRELQDDYELKSDAVVGRKQFDPAGQQLKRDFDEDGVNVDGQTRPKKVKRTQHGEETIEFKQVERPQKITSRVDVEESSNPWLNLGQSKLRSAKSNEVRKAEQGKSQISLENTLGDSLVREKDMTLGQQDLIKQVFAGDDVAQDFENEKIREVDEDKDQVIDETLPGWGSWSNEKPRIQKLRKVAGVNEKQRRDYNKKNVIINEKLNKRTSKYNASAVPFPFENRQQYERSLRMPIGNEWVTKDTFQRQTKPRVLVKKGEIIDPIKKPRSSN